jgi:ABC-type lipoprotein release transport system permease subunit
MPTPPGTTVQWIAHIKIVPRIFVEAYLMSLATALVSVILPALKASHYEIAEALRQNV